jgi:hypothetical protein
MATKIELFSYFDRVAGLSRQYLELGLPLNSAFERPRRIFREVLAPDNEPAIGRGEGLSLLEPLRFEMTSRQDELRD